MRRTSGWWLSWLLPAVLFTDPALAQSIDAEFQQAVAALPDASFADKESLAEGLIASGHQGARRVLTALLEDRLYVRSDDGHVVIVKSTEGERTTFDLVDPLSGRDAGTSAAEALTRIGTNNRLRRHLRTTLARFGLATPDASVRLDAVKEMMRSLDEATIEMLRQRVDAETDASVKSEIQTALALADLDSADAKVRLKAIAALRGRLRPEVRNRLAGLLEKSNEASLVEPDEAVRRAAADAVRALDDARMFYAGIETLFFGLSLGSVLVLAAIGLAITFGVMGVINMAHGELMMLGAYTTYVVQAALTSHTTMWILVAIPTAFFVAGLAGVVIERTVIRFLYGRPLETLLATFGISLVLQQAVRSVFSALNRSVETPLWMSGTLQINEALAITYNRLYIVIFTLLVFCILLLVLKGTRLGLDIRAVSQNRDMARAMGVRTEWVDAMTFGLGAGIAGVAGVALSQLTNVGPNLGQAYIIDSFMVVVFGGVGSLWGTLIGGMSLGVVNKLLEPYSGAVLGKIVVLVALILFIQRRPRGLFPQTGRAAEAQ